ncbi:MAG: histidine phosphatase family protein [Arthrobacter sp.]|jgi:phosphohistidine phosphatase|nr:histidine phosphatase family protein [Arthrobacter sp.]
MSQPARHTLLILRHAKAEAPWGTPDRERGLTERGGAQARWVGELLAARRELLPDGALVSDARRTRATYAWVASRLGEEAPSAYLDERLYDAPVTRVLASINEMPETVSTLVVVAHQPAVQELVLRLASADSAAEAVMEASWDYPTAGLAVLQVPGPWAELDGRDARLTEFLVPPREG